MPIGHPETPPSKAIPGNSWWVAHPILKRSQWEKLNGPINLAIRAQCAYIDQAGNLYDRHYHPICTSLIVDVCYPNCTDMHYGFGVDLSIHPITSMEVAEWFKWTFETFGELANRLGWSAEEKAKYMNTAVFNLPSPTP